MNTSSRPIHHLHEVPDPPALFFRPGPTDHLVLSQLLSEGDFPLSGVVLDASYESQHAELRDETVQRGLWTVLDTRCMEMAFIGGLTNRREKLPWGTAQVHRTSFFTQVEIERLAQQLADHVGKMGYSAILAPTHFLENGPRDEWFEIDRKLVIELRKRLDINGSRSTAIFYPLSLKLESFRSELDRARLIEALSRLPIDCLWLRVNGFGADSGRISLLQYITACRNFHALRIPIIPEKTGAIGLGLLAFRAVSGLECGVSTGEKFDVGQLRRPKPDSQSGGAPARVYIQDLNSFVSREQAVRLFEVRGMRRHVCNDSSCCKSGLTDMIGANRRRHFVHTRIKEVEILAAPPSLRPAKYLDQILRPATDQIARVLGFKGIPQDIHKRLERDRKKLYGWLGTLTNPCLHRFSREEVAEFPRRVVGFRPIQQTQNLNKH